VPGAEHRVHAALTFGHRLGRRRWVVAVFGAAALGSGRSSRATGADVGVGLGIEVKASGQVGGQPREEHKRARGGDGRPTMRSS
jgi:hypothetical protein